MQEARPSPSPRLHGKVALVTGAGGGIGSAAAASLARAGARLSLVDSSAAALGDLRARLADEGVADDDVLTVEADVTSAREVEAYVAQTVERFGGLNVLFNNAGIEGVVATVPEYDEEAFDRVIAVNVKGVFLNLKYGLPAILRSGEGGSVINTASGLGLVGLGGLSAYVASKHAVIGITRSAALELADQGVRVNAVCPGPVDTRMMESLESLDTSMPRDQVHKAYVNNVPMRRYATPDEVAALVTFLASPESSYITGAAIPIDGGGTAD